MDGVEKELSRLKGVGAVLAGRLAAAGLDSFERILAAGEDGLKAIKGMNPRSIPSLLSQAEQMVSDAAAGRLTGLRERAAAVDRRVQDIAADVKSRFGEELGGKLGRKVEKDILRIAGALDALSASLEKSGKRAGKVISKLEKRLAARDGAGLKEIRKGLKKSRKMLKRTGFLQKSGKPKP